MASSVSQPPKETDPDYPAKLDEYIKTVVNPFIGNTLYKSKTHEVILAEYQQNKTMALMTTVLTMLDRVEDYIGVLDLRVIFNSGIVILTSLIEYLQEAGGEPMGQDEIEDVTAQTFQTYLKTKKGKYDEAKMQLYIQDLQQQTQPGGRLEALSAAKPGAEGVAEAAQQPEVM